jgi:hypothetical protein
MRKRGAAGSEVHGGGKRRAFTSSGIRRPQAPARGTQISSRSFSPWACLARHGDDRLNPCRRGPCNAQVKPVGATSGPCRRADDEGLLALILILRLSTSSDSLAIFAAMRRASLRVSRLAAAQQSRSQPNSRMNKKTHQVVTNPQAL